MMPMVIMLVTGALPTAAAHSVAGIGNRPVSPEIYSALQLGVDSMTTYRPTR